ncbi:Imidazolonepropionase [Catalinimonas alkaloidigena]|uniref:Imidazolonepropionase n=1 Tax=Catalinimonas alkaloidigena TaxID=1075417 RepID=A0A1G9LTP8_9BACT|nr:amidohydrolase family protein [Catalinimonas alkaloidigena]SDL65366.1 Imidazolonepropionase [Catalinimonas alkaloidigena]
MLRSVIKPLDSLRQLLTGFLTTLPPYRVAPGCVLLLLLLRCGPSTPPQEDAAALILADVTLIDGTGNAPQPHVDLVIAADTIQAIRPHATSEDATDKAVRDMAGKTVMPLLLNTHAHVGALKGYSTDKSQYTEANILRQLKKYEAYGMGSVVSLGTDRPIVFPLRDSSQAGQLPGATLYTAGYGIVFKGAPTPSEQVFQVATPEEATRAVQELAPLHPDLVKIWVDDFLGTSPKMSPAIYRAVIDEAHRQGLRVASHLYYLEDAKGLVDAGVDIIAHSIRDQEVDDVLIQQMKSQGVYYIPTLALDAYQVAYAQTPDWFDDPFFQASLEPGVLDTLTSAAYQQKVRTDPALATKQAAFETALRNVKKLYEAGVTIALGTDSGAQPIRTQGFSEHLELQLLQQAGIPPLAVMKIATQNGAELLGETKTGTLAPGQKANFLVLSQNPADDIRHTQTILSVCKEGQEVSQGNPAEQITSGKE